MKELKQSAEFTMDQSSELIAMESDALMDAMELSAAAISSLTGLESIAIVSLNDGGASVETASALIAGYNGIMTPFDVVMSGVAVESFDSTVYSVIGTEGILDTVRKTIIDIWNAIKEFLQKWWDKVVDFADKHILGVKKLKTSVGNLRGEIESSKWKIKEGVIHRTFMEKVALGKQGNYFVDASEGMRLLQQGLKGIANTESGIQNVVKWHHSLIKKIDWSTANMATIEAEAIKDGMNFTTLTGNLGKVGTVISASDLKVIGLESWDFVVILPVELLGPSVPVIMMKRAGISDVASQYRAGYVSQSKGEPGDIPFNAIESGQALILLDDIEGLLDTLLAVKTDIRSKRSIGKDYKTAVDNALKSTSGEKDLKAEVMRIFVKNVKNLSASLITPLMSLQGQCLISAFAGYKWVQRNHKNYELVEEVVDPKDQDPKTGLRVT